MDGYHLNIAIVTNRRSWDWSRDCPRYDSTHYARVDLGNGPEDSAIERARDFAARFPQGDKPGQFKLSLTRWQSSGHGVEFLREAALVKAQEGAAMIPGSSIIFAVDTKQGGERCYVVLHPDGKAAIAVYRDEPDVIVSVQHIEGRYVEVRT